MNNHISLFVLFNQINKIPAYGLIFPHWFDYNRCRKVSAAHTVIQLPV